MSAMRVYRSRAGGFLFCPIKCFICMAFNSILYQQVML
jgi:hypothetical protein